MMISFNQTKFILKSSKGQGGGLSTCENNCKEMMADAREKCLSQRKKKSREDREGMFGGKLFFYKIEEVLVTSAGQCAGPRVHPSERAPWWAGISVPRLGNCSNIFAKLGPQDKLSSDWLRTDQWKQSKSNILSWSARLSVVTLGNCIWSVNEDPRIDQRSKFNFRSDWWSRILALAYLLP